MKPRFLPVGDAALLVEFGHEIDPAINLRVQMVDAWLRRRQLRGIIELVPAYASLLIHYDPLVLSFPEVQEWASEQLPSATEIAR